VRSPRLASPCQERPLCSYVFKTTSPNPLPQHWCSLQNRSTTSLSLLFLLFFYNHLLQRTMDSRSVSSRLRELVKVGGLLPLTRLQISRCSAPANTGTVSWHCQRRSLQRHGSAISSGALIRRRGRPLLGSAPGCLRRSRTRVMSAKAQFAGATMVPHLPAITTLCQRRPGRVDQEATQRVLGRALFCIMDRRGGQGDSPPCGRTGVSPPTHHSYAHCRPRARHPSRRLCSR